MKKKTKNQPKQRKLKAPEDLNAEIEKKDFFALLKKAVNKHS